MNIKKMFLYLSLLILASSSIAFANLGQQGPVINWKVSGSYSVNNAPSKYLDVPYQKLKTNDHHFWLTYSLFQGKGRSGPQLLMVAKGMLGPCVQACTLNFTTTPGANSNEYITTVSVKNKPHYSCVVTPSSGSTSDYSPHLTVSKLLGA